MLVLDARVMVLGGTAPLIGDRCSTSSKGWSRSGCYGEPNSRLSRLGEEAATLGAIRLSLDAAEARLFDLG